MSTLMAYFYTDLIFAGIALDRQGYLYVADEFNGRVQMFSPDLLHVTTLVSNLHRPKGVAAGLKLVVTTGDQVNFVKIYEGSSY